MGVEPGQASMTQQVKLLDRFKRNRNAFVPCNAIGDRSPNGCWLKKGHVGPHVDPLYVFER